MSGAGGAEQDPRGDLHRALAQGARLLGENPALAEAQAAEILKVMPGQPDALLLLARARRRGAGPAAALEVLEPLVRSRPDWAPVHLEAGLALAELGEAAAALAALRRSTALDARNPHAWRALADLLAMAGDEAGAEAAAAAELRASVTDPVLVAAATALGDNRLAEAEHMLRGYLKANPTSAPALRMLAETGARLGRVDDAEAILAHCVELAPGFDEARHQYATLLYRQNKPVEAIAQLDRLLARDPRRPAWRNLKAAALGRIGEYGQAIAIYDDLLKTHGDHPKAWMSYGHALKTVGRQADSIAAYRRSLALSPGLGEAWWSLANLKTVRFDDQDLAAMEAQAAGSELSDDDRLHLHYALGKALEDRGQWAASFDHYARGAAIRRRQVRYDPDLNAQRRARAEALYTPAFFAERAGWGCPAPDPIFVVGLPRAGSTLIEQILSSHSQVEGTQELPDIISIAKRLGGGRDRDGEAPYPAVLATLSADEVRALGEEYLERAGVHRKLGRPFFIDKMPNNFAHLGLIRLILPNARVIDARRHPMGCGFSAFKQHFARGQAFSYDLEEVGRFYADYAGLMEHFDRVLPGFVHRVFYEAMVADPEGETRRLLDHCGLPFEAACLRFHENERAVRTASSEQVRRPIYAEGVDQWRNYRSFLGPLEAALGPVLETYPYR